MLERLRVEDFQSLASLDLALGQFTVITGETGAGKSAVVRALRALAFNARGTAFVRQGATHCRIIAQDDLGLVVALQRSPRRDANAYAVSVLGERKTWTKLGGQVPEEVSSLLALSPVNFAGQFDRPFLLDDSGHEAARVLGRLTNVTLVLEAAREGARRRQRLQDKVKVREDDVARLTEEMKPYAAIRQRREELAALETAFAAARDVAVSLAALQARARNLETSEEALSSILSAVPAVPSLGAVDAAWARLSRLRELLACISEQRRLAGQHRHQAEEWRKAAVSREQALHKLLTDAGECPVCGQPVRALPMEMPHDGV